MGGAATQGSRLPGRQYGIRILQGWLEGEWHFGVQVWAVEQSPEAAAWAHHNFQRLSITGQNAR